MLRIDDWTLVHEKTLANVCLGDTLETFRGEKVILKGGTPPHKPSSTGRVRVSSDPEHSGSEYYPSVCGLKWVKSEDHPIELVGEINADSITHVDTISVAPLAVRVLLALGTFNMDDM
jgi:hypothetical protein